MLAISHRHGDHSNAINTLPGNLFFRHMAFQRRPTLLPSRIPQYLRLAHICSNGCGQELILVFLSKESMVIQTRFNQSWMKSMLLIIFLSTFYH